jgi:hypothetical protein
MGRALLPCKRGAPAPVGDEKVRSDGVHRGHVGVVMARKRTLKPTGWVVDMCHYLDE